MYGNSRGDNFYIGTLGPGTAVLSNAPATLKRVFWGGTYVGTTAIYDSATAAGTATTNQVIAVGIPVGNYPGGVELNLRCNDGIVVVESGTPTITTVWGE